MFEILAELIVMVICAVARGIWYALSLAFTIIAIPIAVVGVGISNALEYRRNQKIKRLAEEIKAQGIPEAAEWIGWDHGRKEIFWGPNPDRNCYDIIERVESPKKSDWSRR